VQSYYLTALVGNSVNWTHICPGAETRYTEDAFNLVTMTARKLIARDIPPLTTKHTGRDAFHLLSDFHVKHLPVVQDGKLLGILSEEDVFNHKISDPIGEYDPAHLKKAAVLENEHVFGVIRLMGEQRLTLIPVIDIESNYLGVIAQNDLLRYFSHTASFTGEGAVLVLEMPIRDYSLGNLARIIEEEGIKILSTFVTSEPDHEQMELTLKLNRTDISRAIASLERHGYRIKETFGGLEKGDIMRDRYDALMHYLNI
jgi:acetoin utilization protein AcuB